MTDFKLVTGVSVKVEDDWLGGLELQYIAIATVNKDIVG